MSSLVYELQIDAYNSNVSTSHLLRKALVVAKKLDLTEFEEWILLELNGYPEVRPNVPQYRLITGVTMAQSPNYGWIHFVIPDAELAEVMAMRGFTQSISEIESILNVHKDDSICIFFYPPHVVPFIMSKMTPPLIPAQHIPIPQIHKIINSVRNIVLEWSLKLEKDGILGEGMTFSNEEKHLASTNTYNIETFIGQMNNPQFQPTLIGEITMGDTYKAGQAGAMGPGAQAHDMTFNQIRNDMQGSIDLPKLADELAKLRQEMKKEAVEIEHDTAIGKIAEAETAARSGDGPKALEYLKASGKFALDVASKTASSFIVEMIKSLSSGV